MPSAPEGPHNSRLYRYGYQYLAGRRTSRDRVRAPPAPDVTTAGSAIFAKTYARRFRLRSSRDRPRILLDPRFDDSSEIGNAQWNCIRLCVRARLPRDNQDRAQVFIKTRELSRIGQQSLQIERPFKHRPREMKALKSAPQANLKNHPIAVMRYSCPYKRAAIHDASGKSLSSDQYASYSQSAH